MPMVICVAPNGAITGGDARGRSRDTAIEQRARDARDGRSHQGAAGQEDRRHPRQARRRGSNFPPVRPSFVADPAFNRERIDRVNVALDDPAEARFVKEMEIKPAEVSDSMIVVLAPPGVLVGKFPAQRDDGQIAADLHAAGKCCNDPNCKHNQEGKVAMTPSKLIWKELWQRPTAMVTCLLAIMLGVTALVAIRSVTVYSEKAVAKQMSELGANVLLLPKNASLQDYYAADANGETIARGIWHAAVARRFGRASSTLRRS